MSIATGFLVIVISALIPNLLPIGIFWPISIAVILSAICGISGKFTTLKYLLGVVVGSVSWVAVKFSSWGQMSVMLAVLQVFPTFFAILAFAIANIFSPVHENANT